MKIIASKAYLNKKMDVTILESKHNGMACVALVRDYLAAYPKVLRPLVLILKQFLLKTNLAARNQVKNIFYCLLLTPHSIIGRFEFLRAHSDDSRIFSTNKRARVSKSRVCLIRLLFQLWVRLSDAHCPWNPRREKIHHPTSKSPISLILQCICFWKKLNSLILTVYRVIRSLLCKIRLTNLIMSLAIQV